MSDVTLVVCRCHTLELTSTKWKKHMKDWTSELGRKTWRRLRDERGQCVSHDYANKGLQTSDFWLSRLSILATAILVLPFCQTLLRHACSRQHSRAVHQGVQSARYALRPCRGTSPRRGDPWALQSAHNVYLVKVAVVGWTRWNVQF